MNEPQLVVVDASLSVKWFKPRESGSEPAMELLRRHARRELRIVIAAHGITELVGTAVRYRGSEFGREVWALLRDADVTVVGLDDALADAALEQCRLLGCSFYDALAPALAALLNARLYSADAKAHARFPGVQLLT